MATTGRNIVVIGTSAEGLDALDKLVSQLPTDLSASIFIIQHMAPENSGVALLHRLDRNKAFHCKMAEDDEPFQAERIYIAPAYRHLLVKKTLLVTKGARENRYRPAIDPLFRPAADTHGPKVIGVVLIGMLDANGEFSGDLAQPSAALGTVLFPETAAIRGTPEVDVSQAVLRSASSGFALRRPLPIRRCRLWRSRTRGFTNRPPMMRSPAGQCMAG